MEIIVKVQAPELVDAIQSLSVALAANIELMINGANSRPAVDAPTVVAEIPAKPEKQKTAPTADEEKPASITTIDQVRALFVSKNSAGNRDKLKQILSDFNVKKVTDLQEKDFAAVVARLEEL